MRRACGFGRPLLLSAFLVSLMLLVGIGGAGAATTSTLAVGAETITCVSPNCPITINDNVSGSLIPSVFGGSPSGHRYSWLDRNAPRGGMVKYRLQTVGLDGTRRWLAAAFVAR